MAGNKNKILPALKMHLGTAEKLQGKIAPVGISKK